MQYAAMVPTALVNIEDAKEDEEVRDFIYGSALEFARRAAEKDGRTIDESTAVYKVLEAPTDLIEQGALAPDVVIVRVTVEAH